MCRLRAVRLLLTLYLLEMTHQGKQSPEHSGPYILRPPLQPENMVLN